MTPGLERDPADRSAARTRSPSAQDLFESHNRSFLVGQTERDETNAARARKDMGRTGALDLRRCGMAGWGEDLVHAMREGERNRHLEVVLEGYSAAADVCIEALSTTLDRIESKVDGSKPLSAEEKVLRTELYAIKSKMERSLKDCWRTTYGG